jgi:hypothetical protein
MENRFMIVTYKQQPDGKYEEVTEFRRHAKDKHIQSAQIILDFKKKKVVKNIINPDAGFEDMVEYFKRVLGDQLTPHLPD